MVLAIAAALTAAIFPLSSCEKNQGVESAVTLRLEHTVAGAPLTLNNIQYQAQSGHRYSVERLKYYISNVALVRADGSTYESDAVHYREEGIAATDELTLPDVPDGEYTRMRFIVGLNEATNKPNGLPPTPENINMEWAHVGGVHLTSKKKAALPAFLHTLTDSSFIQDPRLKVRFKGACSGN